MATDYTFLEEDEVFEYFVNTHHLTTLSFFKHDYENSCLCTHLALLRVGRGCNNCTPISAHSLLGARLPPRHMRFLTRVYGIHVCMLENYFCVLQSMYIMRSLHYVLWVRPVHSSDTHSLFITCTCSCSGLSHSSLHSPSKHYIAATLHSVSLELIPRPAPFSVSRKLLQGLRSKITCTRPKVERY